MKKILFIASFMLIAIFACSSVYAADMTAAQLLETVSNKTITLTENTTLTTNLVVPSTVEVIDLNDKTLTLKAGVTIGTDVEITNGTIVRHADFTNNSMISAKGANVELTLNGVTVDGNNVKNKFFGLSVIDGASATIKNESVFLKHYCYSISDDNWGAAIHVRGAEDILVENTVIKENKAEYQCAAAFSAVDTSSVEFKKVIVEDNVTIQTSTVGILRCDSFIFDKDSIIKNNKAHEAAGIHIQDSNAIISGTISGNEATKASGCGGGLYTLLEDATKTVRITDTAKITGNTAEAAGGGVYVTGPKTNTATGKVIMEGGLISGNTAKGTVVPADYDESTHKDIGGAGVYVARGIMDIIGGTIEKNTSTCGIGDAILVSHAGKNTAAGILTIKDGTFDGEIVLAENCGSGEVTGGEFTEELPAELLATGVESVEQDGVYYVGVKHSITIEASKFGTITANVTEAVKGQPVKLTITPKKGYVVDKITLAAALGAEYIDETFIMPAADATISVEFKEMAKDKTPATGSMDVVMLVSAVLSVVTLGVLVSKKYAKNN